MYVQQGLKKRNVNLTGMNKNSSRSHAVLQILVEQRRIEPTAPDASSAYTRTLDTNPDENHLERDLSTDRPLSAISTTNESNVKRKSYLRALLTVVDLAGSERLSKTGSEGMRLEEAKTINKSIACLSNCVSALSSSKPFNFVPFRDSKLTRLLSESLGGNCKTTICACISPSMMHYDESFSTLLFARRAMSVSSRFSANQRIEEMKGMAGRENGAISQSELALQNHNSQLLMQK